VENQGTAAAINPSLPSNKQSIKVKHDCKFVVDNVSGKAFQGEKERE
jgi:hypothetical protein